MMQAAPFTGSIPPVVSNDHDVLTKPSQRLSRLATIFNVLNRECSVPTPVLIEFCENDNQQQLTSRILASADKGIVLEGGHYLPLKNIYRIKIL
ncbi:MAG: hypothetical protein KDC12_00380 [Flavobacteriales bacterium]|nr:hypothetical protein [Flavobacteriales bacterium]